MELFQTWDNTPENFFEKDADGNKPHGKLLPEASEEWFKSGSWSEIASSAQRFIN